jgi:Relaxase/Mobilisation nuclease domain
MISKFLKASSFYHTCRYISQKKGAEVLFVEGVRDHDFRVMAEDFQLQQQSRPGKEKAGAHIILSFHPDDEPSNELMQEMAQKYLTRMKLVNTQIAIVKHSDKNHPHLHIVVNMVDNNGQAIPDSWIGLRGKKTAQQLTQEYNLIPAIQKNLNQTNLEALNDAEATKYAIYQKIKEILPQCKTLELLEFHLLRKGIETMYKYKGQTKEKQGISFKKGNFSFKGSEISREFSLGNLQKTLALHHQAKTQSIVKSPMVLSGSKKHRQSLSMGGAGKTPAADLSKVSETTLKMIAQLLEPTYNEGVSSYDPSSEEERKRKRKRRQRGF